VSQTGSANMANVNQSATNQAASVTQVGSANQATVRQQ
jgi:hypothetical protein